MPRGWTGPAVDGATLRGLRLEQGLTQEALADGAGVSWRTVQVLEQGLRQRVTSDTAERLAGVLGVQSGLLAGNPAFAAESFAQAARAIQGLLDAGDKAGAARLADLWSARAARSNDGRWAQLLLTAVPSRRPRAEHPDTRRITVIDRRGRVCGTATRAEAHEQRLVHRSVILVPARGGKLLCHVRPKGRTFGGMWDCFGEHEEEGDCGDPLTTALRGAAHEVQLFIGARRVAWDRRHFRQVGAAYSWRQDGDTNRERSTLFVVQVPPELELRVFDECESRRGVELREVGCQWLNWDEAAQRAAAGRCADGLRRAVDLYRGSGARELRRELIRLTAEGA